MDKTVFASRLEESQKSILASATQIAEAYGMAEELEALKNCWHKKPDVHELQRSQAIARFMERLQQLLSQGITGEAQSADTGDANSFLIPEGAAPLGVSGESEPIVKAKSRGKKDT